MYKVRTNANIGFLTKLSTLRESLVQQYKTSPVHYSYADDEIDVKFNRFGRQWHTPTMNLEKCKEKLWDYCTFTSSGIINPVPKARANFSGFKRAQLFVTGSVKTRHNSAFSNSILLHFYNLPTQLCVLAKFRLCILKAFEVTVLQSSSNRKIDLYSKYRENKLQMLTKTNVTYEWSEVRTRNLHHRVRYELRILLLGKLFLLLPFITANKVEIHEKTLIANNRFEVTWINGHNLQFLWPTAITQRFSSSSCLDELDDTPGGFNCWPFLHREQGV